VELRVEADPEADDRDLMSLFRWLKISPEVTRHCQVQLQGDESKGTMGSVEIIDIVITNSVAVANLAIAYATFRRMYPKAPDVNVRVGQGPPIRLSSDPQEASKALAEAVENAAEEEPPPPSSRP
jgi:hypothetical protein